MCDHFRSHEGGGKVERVFLQEVSTMQTIQTMRAKLPVLYAAVKR